jgi:hypothetical protein
MQKHKLGVTCLGALFMKTTPGPPEHKILCRHFVARMHRNALHDPHIPPDAETQVQRNVSLRAFYGNRTGLTRS